MMKRYWYEIDASTCHRFNEVYLFYFTHCNGYHSKKLIIFCKTTHSSQSNFPTRIVQLSDRFRLRFFRFGTWRRGRMFQFRFADLFARWLRHGSNFWQQVSDVTQILTISDPSPLCHAAMLYASPTSLHVIIYRQSRVKNNNIR